jgi:DNA-binding transcriptional LysR family regulator
LKKSFLDLNLKRKGFNILCGVERKQLPIDFRHLETFCRVADLKSFSKAADDLFLTQPTVSGHILSLEQSLSLRLFDRTGREVRLTKAGEVFLRHASKILSFRKELLNALSEFSQGIRGELSLGASTIPGEYLLPKLMGDFKKEHPHLNISLKIGDTKEIVQYVLQGNVEFGMTGAKLNHHSLHYEKYEEDEIIVVSPSDHPLTKKKKIDFEGLVQEPWIIREEGSGTQMAVEMALRRKGKSLKQLNVVMEMGSTSSMKEGVKAGLGFAFISKRAVEEDLRLGALSSIEVEGIESIFRPIYIVLHEGRSLSPIGEKFLRFLKKRRRVT